MDHQVKAIQDVVQIRKCDISRDEIVESGGAIRCIGENSCALMRPGEARGCDPIKACAIYRDIVEDNIL